MQTKFIQTDSMIQAYDDAPWASEIIEVEGGYMAFESVDDAQIWKNQQ